MKNIHVLTTNKPSRLFYNVGGSLLYESFFKHNGVNIYITSNEEIPKIRDFALCSNGNIVKVHENNVNNRFVENWLKIILTTDLELIKDGIQAIDDKFLRWFVENPNCEEVNIKQHYNSCQGECGICDNSCGLYYMLITPKEESKEYPIGGFAPGSYYCTCVNCNTMFQGDKRAVQCDPCTVKMTTSEEDIKEKTLQAMIAIMQEYSIINEASIVQFHEEWLKQFKNE
jgi:hypothetical protein